MQSFISVVGIIASTFALLKITSDIIVAKSGRVREEYKLSKIFLEDYQNNKLHPFLIEKGFHAITGKPYSIKEIAYLLSLPSPNYAIYQRSNSGGFIMFNVETSIYEWRSIYCGWQEKIIMEYAFLMAYFVLTLIALVPVYFSLTATFNSAATISFSVTMGILALLCIIKHENLKHAKELMNIQKNLTS